MSLDEKTVYPRFAEPISADELVLELPALLCPRPRGYHRRVGRADRLTARSRAVLQVSRADGSRAARWSGCVSGGEFEQSVDESILLSDILRAYSSDLTFS
jgi:hypothetical protein